MAVPFSDADKWALIALIEDNKDIIENKKTDIASNQNKTKTWQLITDKYNASAEHTRKKL